MLDEVLVEGSALYERSCVRGGCLKSAKKQEPTSKTKPEKPNCCVRGCARGRCGGKGTGGGIGEGGDRTFEVIMCARRSHSGQHRCHRAAASSQ